jgi:hypothetical protein
MNISEENFSKDDILGENIVIIYLFLLLFCYSFDMVLLLLFSNKSKLCMFLICSLFTDLIRIQRDEY